MTSEVRVKSEPMDSDSSDSDDVNTDERMTLNRIKIKQEVDISSSDVTADVSMTADSEGELRADETVSYNMEASDAENNQDSDEVFSTTGSENIGQGHDVDDLDSEKHTDLKLKSPLHNKTPNKTKRRSVSQSPWLKRTPKSASKNVVQEEILISPDACRPVIGVQQVGLKRFLSNGKGVPSRVNLNSTILSAFSDSPDVSDRVSRSSGNQSVLGMTFVGDSPGQRNGGLCTTVIENSPDNSVNQSSGSLIVDQSTDMVLESVQNTPAVKRVRQNNDVELVQDSEEEDSPRRQKSSGLSTSPALSYSKVQDSASEDDDLPVLSPNKDTQQGNLSSVTSHHARLESNDDLPILSVRKRTPPKSPCRSSSKASPNSRAGDSNSESEDDLPKMTLKKRKQAIIASDDDSDGNSPGGENGMSHVISDDDDESDDRGDNLMTDDSDENKMDGDVNGVTLDDSDRENVDDSVRKKTSLILDDSDDDLNDEDDSNMRSFLVDDSEEEEDERSSSDDQDDDAQYKPGIYFL